ncbi:hypothetical protein HY631_02255 [Candidatus Uhrbacteria bacterium]|nr:hypothetical protein [Candidatus Uhrbacteria bacterium]
MIAILMATQTLAQDYPCTCEQVEMETEQQVTPKVFDLSEPQMVIITGLDDEGAVLVAVQVPAARQFVEIPAPATVGAGSSPVTAVFGIATPDFLTHLALDGKAIESAWLAPFRCSELDYLWSAVYARHNFFFADRATREYFASFDLRYRADPTVDTTTIDRRLTSRDRLTQLRVQNAMQTLVCPQEELTP